ncbi:uncharacterized protein LOC114362040 isoform X2 [Ostrinia furnacalis]|uniref:uncharacterized protein LOC114362040 isoform X2 n=1 Tax=Ostrinia furnacalis TaxID=93504 RepID=UPI00103C9AC2|nr:uncharacterized protein LOC114362040 isoform X2 [Ostrinia furnacalis]
MSDTDSLQYLPMERWGELEEAFKTDWPRGISGYTALRTQRDLVSRGLGYGFKVYCPFGDVSSGMVALNKKGTLNEVIIQCPSDDTAQLETAVLCSKIIDWKNKIMVPFMPKHILESVRRIAENLNLDIEAEDTEPNELFLLPKHTPMYPSPSNPDLGIKSLLEDHLSTVDSTWRNRYEGSLWLFGILIKAGYGYGLFKNNELVSWVLLNEVGALTHLFTLEEHRNNKYAEIVLKYLCNFCLKNGKDVFAYCRKGNKSACKVYEKLGFEKFHEVRWCFIKPQN